MGKLYETRACLMGVQKMMSERWSSDVGVVSTDLYADSIDFSASFMGTQATSWSPKTFVLPHPNVVEAAERCEAGVSAGYTLPDGTCPTHDMQRSNEQLDEYLEKG